MVEMLVVLAVLALCVGVAAPSFRDSSGVRSLDNSARHLSALLRATRSAAVLSGTDASVQVDLETKQVRASWTAQELSLPASATVEVLTAREELVTIAKPSFRFFPDGSATGGVIRFRTPAAERAIRIDWLTGRVVREPMR